MKERLRCLVSIGPGCFICCCIKAFLGMGPYFSRLSADVCDFSFGCLAKAAVVFTEIGDDTLKMSNFSL